MTIDYAARARALVGMHFRPQGRGEGGLDCIGVVLATFGIPVDSVRRDYALRGSDVAEVKQVLASLFQPVDQANAQEGDVLLMHAGKDQLHLAVRTDAGFVHADARLRRVVETPGAPEWPILGIYRKLRSS